MVPQTWYKSVTEQGGWKEVGPIEFGGIKLIDATDPASFDLHDGNDKVLDYDGVGSTIICRLNVCRTSKVPQTYRLTFSSLSQFSGRNIGQSKVGPHKSLTRGWLDECYCQILTTNNKSVRERITKKKLAFEVAKFVWNHFESVKVNTAFTLIDPSPTSNLLGRIRLRRHNFREHSVIEIGPCLESILATSAPVRGSCPRSLPLLETRLPLSK